MAQETENRQNDRSPFGVSVQYSKDGKKWKKAESVDISVTGMRLKVPEAVTPQSVLHLNFAMPNRKAEPPVKVDAEVVRITKSPGNTRGLGLRFLEPPEKVMDFLEDNLPVNPGPARLVDEESAGFRQWGIMIGLAAVFFALGYVTCLGLR